jgi:uncharacterized protein (DUF58 family)
MIERKELSSEIIQKIKNITLYTRRIVRNQLAGQAHSFQRGTGLDFDNLREYQLGDDVRFIDWNASSRMDTLFVREFRQEQTKTILLIVDVSASMFYGTVSEKFDTVAQLASAVALVSFYAGDAVGLLLFSDEVELYLPPKKDRQYVYLIMQALFSCKPKSKKTKSGIACQHIAQAKLKDTITFWFSDCIDNTLTEPLKSMVRVHDVYMMRCLDPLEKQLPSLGYIYVQDIETGATGGMQMGTHNSYLLRKRLSDQTTSLNRLGCRVIDVVDVKTTIEEIVRIFSKQSRQY